MNRSFSHRLRKISVSAALILVVGMVATPSRAQWLVHDNSMDALNEANAGWQKSQLGQLLSQYQQLQQTYDTIKSSIGSLGLNLIPVNNNFPTISDSDAQAQAANQCPGADPIGMILTFAGVDMSGDVRVQQAQICQQIVLRQIHKYNTVAAMLNRMNDYSSSIDQIMTSFNKISNVASGDRETSQAQTDQTLTSMSMDMNNTNQSLQADDIFISTLQTRQSQLARRSMQGSLLGNAMQVVSFGAALNIGN